MFFKKKKNNKMSWDDVSLDTYLKIRKIDSTAEGALFDMIALLFGEDVLNEPLDTFKAKLEDYNSRMEFLGTKIEPKLPKKVYCINEREYVLDLKSIKTAQYMDFTNLSKNMDIEENMEKFIAIFLVPKGKNYGEYDFEEVYQDILSMPITEAMSIAVFFKAALLTFIQNFRYYSEKKVMRLKIPKKEKKTLIEAIRRQANLAYYHL